MQSKLAKARIYSFDLLAHLQASTKQHEKSREHTTQLTQNISGINNRINALSPRLRHRICFSSELYSY